MKITLLMTLLFGLIFISAVGAAEKNAHSTATKDDGLQSASVSQSAERR